MNRVNHTQPLDHFYLELDDQSLAVVVGNWHFQCCILGYVKYVPTRAQSTWRRSFINYERLLKVYNPEEVYKQANWTIYVPFFDTKVPYIPVSRVLRVYDPTRRALELHYKASDQLEEKAICMLSLIEEGTGVLPGVTGSLLPGIHNVHVSDIDIVVYGSRNSREVIEFVDNNRDVFKPLNETRLKAWSKNIAYSTGLSENEVLKYYRNWRRGYFADREYSIIYNDGTYKDVFLMPSYITRGIVRAVLEVHGDLRALNYPSIGMVTSYRIVESRCKVDYDISYLMSYEALYVPGLHEGGVFEVSGLLQCSAVEETCRILVGSHEYRGFMKWLH
ncbi:MAG: hypothetical protein QXE77_00440 [Desulfurococcaceae archaeon]